MLLLLTDDISLDVILNLSGVWNAKTGLFFYSASCFDGS